MTGGLNADQSQSSCGQQINQAPEHQQAQAWGPVLYLLYLQWLGKPSWSLAILHFQLGDSLPSFWHKQLRLCICQVNFCMLGCFYLCVIAYVSVLQQHPCLVCHSSELSSAVIVHAGIADALCIKCAESPSTAVLCRPHGSEIKVHRCSKGNLAQTVATSGFHAITDKRISLHARSARSSNMLQGWSSQHSSATG